MADGRGDVSGKHSHETTDGHDRAHPDPADLALAALPAEPPDPAVTAHLNGCGRCREHVDALAHTVTLAQDGSTDVDAVPVPERVWTAIAAELGAELGSGTDPSAPSTADGHQPPTGRNGRRVSLVLPGSAVDSTDGRPPTARRPTPPPSSPPTPPPSSKPFFGRPWRVAAAAVVALLVGAGIGVGIDRAGGRADGSPPPLAGVVAQLVPVGSTDPASHGTLTSEEHDGVRTMVVHLTGVTDPAGADFLEAWLMNPATREIVALGALTMDGTGGASYDGAFTVPTNLPMDQLPVVDISAEHYDGDPGHSGVSLLRGTLS